MILIPLALSILFAMGLIVFAFRPAGLHPGLGVVIARLLLVLAFCRSSYS